MWQKMKARCANPATQGFEHYGGRGIKVCDRWMEFENFIEDMGEAPEGYSLERIDVNGNYERANCKWIPIGKQQLNKRLTKRVTIDGREMAVKEACEMLGRNYKTVMSRINILKRTPEEALELDGKMQRAKPKPRRFVMVEIDGVQMSLRQAAMARNLPYYTVMSRINIMGWDVERALGLSQNCPKPGNEAADSTATH